MRARENRQNAEDQRSIVGSIGYIAGNMGYMEGNLSAIDYTYGAGATHYPLWKPHFPRGEAPPPYEEAVAISQAEALSAQCTVTLPASNAQRAVATVSQQQQTQSQIQAQVQQQQQIQHLQQHTLQLHTQPQQHHPPYGQQLVAHAHPHPHPQSNQYTQSTINININSGGVTTIATGENHQPPYSLQTEQQQQQLSLEHHQQQQQQQQQHLVQPPVSSGSICLQAMPKPPTNAECSYKNCHLNISASVTTAAATSSRRSTPRGSQELLHQLPLQTQQQQYLTVADVEINASASAASYHSLPAASTEAMATPTHIQQQQQPQHLLAPAIELLQPLEIATISAAPTCSTADSVTQTTQMPLTGTLKNTQIVQQQQQQYSKTPSSSRRYHRTIPRYFAVADPLQVKPKTSSSAGSGTEKPVSKKPMCQCPIQHVPMSYMGSTANANAFLSGAGKLFGTTTSGGSSTSTPTCSLSPGTRHAATLAYGQRAKSSTNLQQQAQDLIISSSTLRRSGCGHEPKIATISKQVGDETHHAQTGSNGGVNVSAIIPPPPLQHPEEISAPPIVLGRVQKRSSSSSAERARSSSGGTSTASGTRSVSSGADSLSTAYLNRKVDAYLSLTQKQQQHFYNQQTQQQPDPSNPTLPPKLYKSLTNLKSVTAATAATSSSSSSGSGNNNASVAAIYTLSKPTPSAQRSKEQAPTLTLPPASPSAGSAAEKLSSGKINSSTFYPLANHVTYTLPKHIGGKVSLNSTINSVVSKVPSVISIPPVENNNAAGTAAAAAAQTPGKSTTLPKILRVKTGTGTGTALAIAHCQMPTYPLNPGKTSSSGRSPSKQLQLPVCTTSKNCQNPKEHFLPNDTSLDDDYLSECENCKIAQSAKYYLDAEMLSGSSGGGSSMTPQETMTLQRKSLEETKDEPQESYYRSSHTLPSNAKKHGKNNNRESWQFSTIPAASSSDEDVNE
ncbi:hypothetical protein KR026_004204 [Drosophila bipectinata]|nr:hypothetical protein KR026_004204 [Drosophila bipectinata]